MKKGNATSEFDVITVTGLPGVQTFTLISEADCKEKPSLPVVPSVPTPSVELVQFEENPACTANQTYAIYTSAGEFVQYVKTNEKGIAIAFLKTGEYMLLNAEDEQITTFKVEKDVANSIKFSTTCLDVPNTNPGSGSDGNPLPPIELPGGGTDEENPNSKPDTDNPGTNEPGTETPGTTTPGTNEPGTETPGANTPNTSTPNNTTSGVTKKPGNTSGSGSTTNSGNTTSTTGNTTSGNNVSSNNTSSTPTVKLPQTDVDNSSSNYLQLLGAFVFIRRRQLNK